MTPQRPLRFRVWDKETRTFLYNEGFQAISFQHDGAIFPFGNGYATEHWPDRFTVTQFTGLKDDKGADIWEGDIVTLWLATYPLGSGVFEIVFHHGAFQLKTHKLTGVAGLVAYENGLKPLCTFGESVLEIIGNVFENGDLLK